MFDLELVAERLRQFVARRRRHAAKLHGRPVAADRVDPGRLLVGVDPDKAVEVGQFLPEVVGIAFALDRLPGLVGNELEGAGPHDVLLVPVRVLLQNLLLVDVGEGVGERRQECRGREFEAEHDGFRVGRLDLVDHQVIALARAEHSLRRKDDLVPARCHVGGGQWRAVVPFDAVADREGVGLAAVGGLRHVGAEVADELARTRVLRVDPDQEAVERRGRMDRREGAFAMPVEARRRVGRDHVGQRAAAPRGLGSDGRRNAGHHRDQRGSRCNARDQLHAPPPTSGVGGRVKPSAGRVQRFSRAETSGTTHDGSPRRRGPMGRTTAIGPMGPGLMGTLRRCANTTYGWSAPGAYNPIWPNRIDAGQAGHDKSTRKPVGIRPACARG